MNLEQILSLVRTLLAAGGPVAGLLTIYGFPQDKTALWLGLGLAVIPPIVTAVWGVVSKTDRALVETAATVPGASVVIDPVKASVAVVAAAQDPAVPNVNPKPPI